MGGVFTLREGGYPLMRDIPLSEVSPYEMLTKYLSRKLLC